MSKREVGEDQPILGGFHICRPAPIYLANKKPAGLRLMSDLHIGASHVDYKLIDREINDALEHNDRVLINGDLLDLILPKDAKRFQPDSPHPRIARRNDQVNAAIDWAVEILGPVAHLVDMLGLGNHECFDGQTEILTKDGWVLLSELRSDQQVASYRVATGKIEYDLPIKVHRYHYNGEMITIKNRNVDLCVTPNHRMLWKNPYSVARRLKGNGRRHNGQGCAAYISHTGKWRSIRRIDGKVTQGRSRNTKEEVLEELDSFPSLDGREYLSENWMFVHAGRLPRTGGILPCTGQVASGGVSFTDDEIRASAWLLTDGWITKKGSVRICQRKSKSHLVRSVLDSCKWEYGEDERNRDIVAICGRALKNRPESSIEFHVHGKGLHRVKELVPHKKHLPKWLWDCTKAQFDIFLSAYVDGDGTRRKNGICKTVTIFGRLHFLDDLQALCTQFGYRTVLSEGRKSINGKIVHDWRLYVNPRTTIHVRPKAIGKRWYEGMVYCVTTKNNTVVVRRNGRVVITGNSAVQKFHSIDPTLLVLYELEKISKQRDPDHVIHYGGYTGFVDYRLKYSSSDKNGGSYRWILYYHHGSGGAAPVTRGIIDFNRKDVFIDSDMIWMGHKHQKMSIVVEKLRCPFKGEDVEVREVHHVMTGAYFSTYVNQSQKSVREHGRKSNYAADLGLAPGGRGGVRVELTSISHQERPKVRIIQ